MLFQFFKYPLTMYTYRVGVKFVVWKTEDSQYDHIFNYQLANSIL